MPDGTKVVKTLPTWVEAEAAVEAGEYTSLHEFIYSYEPGGDDDCKWRKMLSELIRDVFASGIEVGMEHQKRNTEPKQNEQSN